MPRKRLDMDEHGVYAYTRLGCRCETCRAKIAQQRAKYRNPNNSTNYNVRYGSSPLRLPTGPLLDFMEKHGYTKDYDRSQISKWRKQTMSIYTIDKYCIKYGTHPVLLYGDAFYADIQDEDAA